MTNDGRSRNVGRRNGYMLTECLVAIAVGAVVMGIAVTLLAAVLRIEGVARNDVYHNAAVHRLARQFRRDVHAALEAGEDRPQPQADDDGEAWQFELPRDRTVTYRIRPAGLVRTERSGEKVLHQESFALPPESTAGIEKRGDGDTAMVSLLISPRADSAGVPTARVDAVLARDRRFARPQPPLSEESDG